MEKAIGSKTMIKEFLYDHAAGRPVSFHMPGHKGSALYRRFGYDAFFDGTCGAGSGTREGGFLDLDITEIPGADDLFVADGIIGRVQERYAELYGAKRSYLMVNGTSGALIASILTCVPRGGKMIIGTNSHRAVTNGLALAGAEPVFVEPVSLWGGDVEGPVDPDQVKKAVEANLDAYAILITSPNYYGIVSDIEKIAAIAHEAGMILIVDQAHGAHLAAFGRFGRDGNMPAPAEKLGADIVTCSVHKTMASMTQSAVLHVISDRVDTDVIEEKLWMVESSSPSYILMASLDINADLVEKHGEELIREWDEGLDLFYEEAAKIRGIRTLCGYIEETGINMSVDRSKIVVDAGMPAEQLEGMLMERNIFCEKKNGSALVCLSGIGNTKEDYAALAEALREIAQY